MERAKPGEIRERFDSRKMQREQTLKRKLIRWAQDNRQRLESSRLTKLRAASTPISSSQIIHTEHELGDTAVRDLLSSISG
jgi:hypothetical protein